MQRPLLFAFVLLILLLGGIWWWNASTDVPQAPGGDTASAAASGEHATAQTGAPAITEAASTSTPQRAEATTPPAADALTAATLTAATLRLHLKWPDGTPAEGVRVRLRGWSQTTRWSSHDFAASDEQGTATFHDVLHGRWRMETHRGDREVFEMKPGVADIEIELEAGVTIAGIVVDEHDHPVADAAVWLQTRDPKSTGGSVIATTEQDGTFHVERVPSHVSLGAFAAGYLRSALVDLDVVETERQPVAITLRLPGNGGVLRGLVTDDHDRPLAGAQVGLGDEKGFLDMRGERVIERWSIPNTRTDTQGRFTLVGLKPGDDELSVRAMDHGCARLPVTIPTNDAVEVHVRMPPSGTVRGVVRDADGAPIANAHVRGYDREPRTDFLAGGQIDFEKAFGYRSCHSDEQGRYELSDVAPGKVWLFAQPGGRWRDGVPVLVARAELEVPPGGTLEWNPVLSKGRTIRGVVRYRDGHPLANIFLTLRDEHSTAEHVLTNDREGRFEFVNLEDTSYTIQVQYWDAPKGTPTLERSSLRPDSAPVELVAPYDKPVKQANGTVLGRIDDAGLRITNLKAARVALMSDKGWFHDNGKLEDGAFRFEELRPCRFRLALMQDEAMLAGSDWFELQPGAVLDTGVLRTVRGGSVSIQLVREAGAEALTPTLYLKRDDAPRSTTVAVGTATTFPVDSLTPGDYEVVGYAEGMVAISARVSVAAGDTTPLEVKVLRGALVRFEAWIPANDKPKRCSYSITRGTETVDSFDGQWGRRPTLPHSFARRLAPGRYTIRFTTETLNLSTDFEVGADCKDMTVRLDPTPR